MVDLLVIAGEHSGDNHAAGFVRDLKARHPRLSICAVGGPALQTAGAHLLTNLVQYSVVGLVETFKHYSYFLRLMRWLVEWVRVYQPKAICLVDFPGFNLRFAQCLFREKLSKKAGGSVTVCEYITPQIWAWKARRRFLMERVIDHLAVIFPFEIHCFADTTLDVTFVGHPLLQERSPFTYDSQGPLLLLPGSRMAAVRRIYPILYQAFRQLRKTYPGLKAIVPVPSETIHQFLQTQSREDVQLQPIEGFSYGVRGAIMSSGTASLQIALAGIPGVITYRAHPFTFFLGKHIVQIPYLSMANILLQKQQYSECLQDKSQQTTRIAQQMRTLLAHPEVSRQNFLQASMQLRQLLMQPQQHNVADWLEPYCL